MPKEIPVARFKYVGPHDAIDIPGVGTFANGEAFDTDLNLSGRDDFAPVRTKKED